MNTLKKILAAFERHMGLIVLAAAALSLFLPSAALWIRVSWIGPLLMIIMFGMGLTLKPRDFALVFTRPRDMLVGCAAQFLVMPLLAFALCRLFRLDPALAAGVALVGACPGGTASNVITFLARGDVALSVGMTSVNTLLAPLLTPCITYLLLRETVSVDVGLMFSVIVKVIVLPIGLGLLINRYFENLTRRMVTVLPAVSELAICLTVAAVVSHNADRILTSGALVLAVVMLHNLLGLLCGFTLGRALKMDAPRTRALSLEIGMQNSGLAAALAATAFPHLALAPVPGAIFSVWHNISGALLAWAFRKWGQGGLNPCA